MKRSQILSQAGVTLTELLVVLVIVSILSTLAVPVYMNKADEARKAVAEAECRQIAEAEEACAIAHGFYVPLQLLDDQPANTGTKDTADTIDREPGGGALSNQGVGTLYLVDAARNYFFLDQNQPVLDAASSDPRVVRMIRKWQGPFLNPQRVYIGNAASADPNKLEEELNRRDLPLDPWGQPYRFYSPLGLIGTDAQSTDPEMWRELTFSDGVVTRNDSSRSFDKFAIVSWGPDGLPNTMSTDADDVIYFFGRMNPVRNETDSTYDGRSLPTPTPIP